MTLRKKKSIKQRHIDDIELNLKKKVYVLCEGEKTEKKYFRVLYNNRSELKIDSLIELIHVEKTGKTKGYTKPEQLFELASSKLKEYEQESYLDQKGKKINPVYDKNIDRFLVVFDCDWESCNNYEKHLDEINKLEELILKYSEDFDICISNPCFEFWLLLHHDGLITVDNKEYDNVCTFILENEKSIKENKKISKHTYLSKIISDNFNFNTKKTLNNTFCVEGLDTAIKNERYLIQKYEIKETVDILKNVSCNLGSIIKDVFYA